MKILIIQFLFVLISCASRNENTEQTTVVEKSAAEKYQMKLDSLKADTDNDGVINYTDKCPNTPKGAKVDGKGCPMDTDLDGVIDLYDQCITIPGSSTNKGCP